MRAALRYGGAAPPWAALLHAAETWGVPPWIVEEHDDALYWLERLAVYEREKHAATERLLKRTEDDNL